MASSCPEMLLLFKITLIMPSVVRAPAYEVMDGQETFLTLCKLVC